MRKTFTDLYSHEKYKERKWIIYIFLESFIKFVSYDEFKNDIIAIWNPNVPMRMSIGYLKPPVAKIILNKQYSNM